MCGINGKLTFNKVPLLNDINSMNNKIIHRGPDDDGTFTEQNDFYSIALGMRRLSIIDLASGNQPMYSKDKQVIIVFNGEIYNYKELKAILELEGVKFNTSSDTEVILQMYLNYGTESFRKLDGMFAFSIYDENKKKLFITRDYFGEKPLYYTSLNGDFIWGSELKSIHSQLKTTPSISKKGLELFFSLTYIPAPYTIYEGVSKLEQNSFIEFDIENKNFEIQKIILEEGKVEKKFEGSIEEAKKITKTLVEESVMSRSVADVPIGTFLSGGVDSSVVTHCLAKNINGKINTFSIGFDKKSFNETDKSKVVAKLVGSNHHEFIVNEKLMEVHIDEILHNFDEPFADASAIPTYMVAHKTSEHLKVALTGDGGDEVFGGYNKYYINSINRSYTKFIPQIVHKAFKGVSSGLLITKDDNRGKRFKIKKALESIDYHNNFYWNIISLGFKKEDLDKLLMEQSIKIFDYYKNDLRLNKSESLYDLRKIDKHVSLEGDMLVKVDRTSMLTSLECRAPFLNKKIWDFTNTLPEDFLINKGSKKFILKEAFKEAFPDRFLDKSKKGFGVPVGDWLRTILRNELLSYVEKTFVEKQGIFNYNYISEITDKHIRGIEDNTFKVWTYYCFQKWYKRVFD